MPRESRVDFVYEFLIGELLRGELLPGDLVKRREVAQKLKISVSPVTEAFKQLEFEGMLETVPRKGTRVRQATQQDVWGLLITRIALECQVARMVCGAPIKQHYPPLKKLAKAADSSKANPLARFEADMAFHVGLAALTECPALIHNLGLVLRQSFLWLKQLQPVGPVASPHTTFLDSLQAAKAERASTLMREHIQKGKMNLGLERGKFVDPLRPRFGKAPDLMLGRAQRSLNRFMKEEPK